MIDAKELRRLAQAVSGWSNCNQAWLDQSEDAPAAVVGHIDEDGNTYPVATIDCDQYYAGHQSLPLAKFYAAVNPAAVSELLDRLEAAESARRDDYQNWMTALDRNAELLAKLEAAKEDRSNFLVEMGKLCAKCDALCLRIEATEKERDELRALVDVLRSEISSLRAKVAEMEKQEPVAWMSSRNGFICKENKNPDYNVPLYTPPAQGEKK